MTVYIMCTLRIPYHMRKNQSIHWTLTSWTPGVHKFLNNFISSQGPQLPSRVPAAAVLITLSPTSSPWAARLSPWHLLWPSPATPCTTGAKAKGRPLHVQSPQPPTPADQPQPNSEYQNQCTSLWPSLYSLSLALSIYIDIHVYVYIYSKLSLSHWCFILTYPSRGPITLVCAGILPVQHVWGVSLLLFPSPAAHSTCSTTSH